MLKRGVILFLLFITGKANAQLRYGYNQFDKPLMGFQQIMPPAPQPSTLAPSIVGFNTPAPTNSFGGVDVNKRNELLRREVDQQIERQIQEMRNDYEDDLMELEGYRKEKLVRAQSKYYRTAFTNLLRFNPDSFSLTKAVYLIENAFFDGHLLESTYLQEIQKCTNQVRSIIKAQSLNTKDNSSVNYAIQRLFAPEQINRTVNTNSSQIMRFKYDFEDFRGEKDYTKMFVSKALATHTGQCHSLPLVYLIIAEQLGAKANLSLAPQHTFIQFKDRTGRTINFETTHGYIASTSWMMQSAYITSVALQKKTYLSSLSTRQLFAQMLSDFLLGYLAKFPYDDFAEEIRREAISVSGDNLTALLVEANMKTLAAKQQVDAVGRPKEADLPKYPAAYKSVKQMEEAYERVDATGFQDMPAAAYQSWLLSIEKEKKKQGAVDTKNTKGRMQTMLNR